MSLLETLQFHAWNGPAMVRRIIIQWEPEGCSTEKQYERSLYDYLHEEFQTIQITKQYAKGRIRADIVVGDKVIIEIKNNLDTTGKYQRLVGQIAGYKGWDGSIIILLVGKTDKNLRKELDRHLKAEDLYDDEKVSVLEKS